MDLLEFITYQEPVAGQYVMSLQTTYYPSTAINTFHLLWKELHGKTDPTSEWFNAWIERLPNNSCDCETWTREYLTTNPPIFSHDEWFPWTVNFHNAVSRKPGLDKPQWSLIDAIALYRPDLWPRQPKINNLLLVTSLSPLTSHQEQQAIALESWKRFGLDVLSVNLPSEIKRLSEAYDVEFVETTESGDHFNRKTPTINSLAAVSVERDVPILLLNSDCALYGPQRLVLDVPQVGIGIRHNWTDHLSDATQEQWGLDAFILHPEHAQSLPRLPFGIGQPMWDYWVAWHMGHMGFRVDWIGSKLIYHKSHPTHWSPEDCQVGRNWITEHYKTSTNWVQWREQQPHTFSVFSPFRK